MLEYCPYKMNEEKSRGNRFLNSKSSCLKFFAPVCIWKWISTYLALISFLFFLIVSELENFTNKRKIHVK